MFEHLTIGFVNCAIGLAALLRQQQQFCHRIDELTKEKIIIEK